MSTLRPLLMALVLAALVVGCGSSGGSPSAKPSDGASAAPSSAASAAASADTGSSPEPAASEGGGGGSGDAGIPAIADGPWNTSTLHVEISGDRSTTIDMTMPDGAGYTTDGFTILAFRDSAGTTSAQVSLSQEAGASAIVVTTPELATGGIFGDTCDLRITKNDPSALAGEFECDDVDGVSTTQSVTYKLNLRGTFEAAR